MSVYFVDPYVKYYNGLKNVNELSSVVSKLTNDTNQLSNSITQLQGRIGESRWKELGQESISNSVLPLLSTNLTGVYSDVTNNINQVVTTSVNIYEETTKLKANDEKYEKSKEELVSINNSEPSYYSSSDKTSESSNHRSWRERKSSKETEIEELTKECKTNQSTIDSYVTLINSLSIADEVEEIVVPTNSNQEGLNVDENARFSVDIPSNISQSGYTVTGYDRWIKTGKEMVWASGTNQRALSEVWKRQGSKFKNGIAVVNINGQDRYLIATTSKYGKVGDSVTVHLQDGSSIPCIIADQKSSGDSNYDTYGHRYGNQVNISLIMIHMVIDMVTKLIY